MVNLGGDGGSGGFDIDGGDLGLDEVDEVVDDDVDEGSANEGGEIVGFLDFSGFRKTLIFIGDGEEEETRSYSSIRFARSSSEVTETSASRSSVGS